MLSYLCVCTNTHTHIQILSINYLMFYTFSSCCTARGDLHIHTLNSWLHLYSHILSITLLHWERKNIFSQTQTQISCKKVNICFEFKEKQKKKKEKEKRKTTTTTTKLNKQHESMSKCYSDLFSHEKTITHFHTFTIQVSLFLLRVFVFVLV